MVAERIREYEMVMILSPEATRDEVAATVDRVDGLISGGGGSVVDHESWGLKRLAYEIDDFNEGNYVLTKFTLDASGVTELNRALTASEDIVRYLVTRQEFPKPKEDPEEAAEAEASSSGGAEASSGGAEASSGGAEASSGGAEASSVGAEAPSDGAEASSVGAEASSVGAEASSGGAEASSEAEGGKQP